MSQVRAKSRAIVFTLLACLTIPLVGCGTPADSVESEPPPDPAEVLDTASRDAADALTLFQAAGGNHRLQLVQNKVHVGLAAIEQLESEEGITAGRLLELGKSRADLMVIGWQGGDEDFEQKLLDLAVEVGESDPDGELAAYLYAKCFEVRCMNREGSDAEEAIGALRTYVETFGPDDQVKSLFTAYGKQLQDERRWDHALACYAEAVSQFPQDAEIVAEHTRLANYYARWQFASYRKQQAHAALKAKLGNLEQGPFVIASWYDKHGSGMGKFKFIVLNDINAVSAYASDLPAGSLWWLMRAFPNTVEGRERAGELRAKLQKQKLVCCDTNISKTLNNLRNIAWSN